MNVSTSKLQAAFANLLTLMAKSEKTTVVTDSLLKLAQQADREKLLACIDDVIINNADEFVNYLIWCLSKIELDRKHASTVVSPCSRCQLTDTALTITPLSDEVSDARPIELTVPTLINAVSGHNGAANDHISNTVNMLSREELRDAYNAKFSVPLSQLRSGLTEADFANGNTLADTAQPDDQLLFVLYKLLVSMVMYAGFMRVFQDYTKWVLHSAQRASEEYVGLWNEDTIRALRSKINESLVSLTPVEQALLHFLAHIYAPCPNMVQKICTRVSAKMAGTNM